MKTPYDYVILRYIHDPVVGEFVNFGVVVYSEKGRFLKAKCNSRVGRIARFFGGIESEQFQLVSEYLQEKIELVADRFLNGLELEKPLKGLVDYMQQALPADDSSIQFSSKMSGLSENLDLTLSLLFERYISRFSDKGLTKRDEKEIWSSFRKKLDPQVLYYLKSQKIESKNAEYEFEHAWKNEKWHLIEPVSFDHSESQYIRRKAFNWLGIAEAVLKDKKDECKLELIVGVPSDKGLFKAFDKAMKTLDGMSCPHELILEEQSDKFAKKLESAVIKHSKEK